MYRFCGVGVCVQIIMVSLFLDIVRELNLE